MSTRLRSAALTVMACAMGASLVLIGGLRPGVFDAGILAAVGIRRFGLVRMSVGVGLVAVVLAATTPICGATREDAYRAAIASDLRNLTVSEEVHFVDHAAYTASAQALGFAAADGVVVSLSSTGRGWTAWATHAALDSHEGCGIYVGEPPAPTGVAPMRLDRPARIVCTWE